MMLIIASTEKIYSLKRAIEREFLDLFPSEQPYVVAKLEDAHGFSLSNGSNIGDFIANGQMIYAQPEGVSDPNQSGTPMGQEMNIHGGQNAQEMVQMMKSLQHNIVNKLAISSDFKSFNH